MKELNSALTVMLIEPSTNVRTSLHNIFTQCGITQITHVMRASTAVPILQKKVFDIILCEYDLSEGQDGQQLLEDLRRHHLLPPTTLFLMVTAERSQGKVISTVELAPTEYLLKPFTTETLLERLSRALEKRTAFMPVYQAIGEGKLAEAIACCERGEAASQRYALEFRFMRAELHLNRGQAEQAEAMYRELAETRAVEWARLGLAKSLCQQKRLGEAEEILSILLEENGRLWDAYDCLARVLEAGGRLPEAKQVLKDAVELAPHTVRRLRKLGRLAMDQSDFDTALTSFQEVVGKVRHSRFREPEDYVYLVQALLEKGNPAQAGTIVRELAKSLSDFQKTEACGAISSALVHEYNGEIDSTMEKLAAAVAACGNNAGLSDEMKMLLAQACLNNRMEDSAETVALDVMHNASDESTLAKAAALVELAGRKGTVRSPLQQSSQELAELVAACDDKLEQGDYAGAVELMSNAVATMPNNAEVVLNAVATVLACIENTGWDDDLGTQANRYLESARRLDASSRRLNSLSNQFRAVLKKYNIPVERMGGKARA